MAQHADGQRQPECICDRRQSPFAQVVRHLVHDYRLFAPWCGAPLLEAPRGGPRRSPSSRLYVTVSASGHGRPGRESPVTALTAVPFVCWGTDERGDQPAAETTALGRPWSPVVQVTEPSQKNLGASLGIPTFWRFDGGPGGRACRDHGQRRRDSEQGACVEALETCGLLRLSRVGPGPGWSSLSRPPICRSLQCKPPGNRHYAYQLVALSAGGPPGATGLHPWGSSTPPARSVRE